MTATAASVSTDLTARVGRNGTKAHRVYVSVQVSGNPKRLGEAVVLGGNTHCGSQRWGSGSRMLPIGTAITCLKCAARPAAKDHDVTFEDGRRFVTVADPTKVVEENRRGELVPTEWAREMVGGK